MSDALFIYLKINFLLWVSLSLFYFIFLGSERYFRAAPKKITLTIARVTFILSIISPVFLPAIETGVVVPTISVGGFRAVGDGQVDARKNNDPKASVEPTHQANQFPAATKISLSIILQITLVVGFLFFVSRFVKSINTLKRWLRDAVIFRKTKTCHIYLSSQLKVPISFFYFPKSIVILPQDLIANPKCLRLALAHECQHIRQYDVHWAYLLEFLKAIFWWNPAMFFWASKMDYIAELSCDEQVLSRGRVSITALDYAHCLVDFAEKALRQRSCSLMSGMASHNVNTKTLSRRIDMLTSKSIRNFKTKFCKLRSISLVALLLGSALAIQVRAAKDNIQVNHDLQRIIDGALVDGLKQHKAKSGFAVLADSQSGQILAVSRKALQGTEYKSVSASEFLKNPFEPFSLLKPIVAAIAIEKKKVDEQTVLDARGGKISFGDRVFHDWKDHGNITVADSIANSSFIGAVRMAQLIGERDLVEGIKKFGVSDSQFHLKTGSEAAYNLPNIANGTGILFFTVEDILRSYSVFANNGDLVDLSGYDPGIAKAKIIGRAVSQDTAQRVKHLLLQTMQLGTGRWAQSANYTIAGKTGTGFLSASAPDSNNQKADRAEFVGFAPYDNPRLISLVIVDHPEGAAHGGSQAAPVVRSILNQSLKYLKVKSDRAVSAN